MAYNKNTWQNGDKITAEKLNNMEDGIATSVLRIDTISETIGGTTTVRLAKTFAEIKSHIDNGGFAVVVTDMEQSDTEYATYIEPVSIVKAEDLNGTMIYTVQTGYVQEEMIEYKCDEVDAYPAWNDGK